MRRSRRRRSWLRPPSAPRAPSGASLETAALLVLLAAAALGAGLVRDWHRARLRLAAYHACAEARGGVVYEPAWGTGALGFEVRCSGRILSCTERTVSSGEGLRFHTDVRLAFAPGDATTFRVRLATPHALASLPKLYAMVEAAPGDARLDGRLVVQANEPERLPALLAPGVRDALDELVRAQGGSELVVAVDEEGILVTTDRRLPTAAAVEAHVATCVELFGALLGALDLRPAVLSAAEAGGVMLLPPGPDDRRSEPVCQVCGQAIEGDEVRCARCATPHHRDCWSYNARCATYGCGGRTAA